MSRGATLPYSIRQSLLSHKTAGLSHNETDRLSDGGAQGTLVPYLCAVFQVICIVYHVLKIDYLKKIGYFVMAQQRLEGGMRKLIDVYKCEKAVII